MDRPHDSGWSILLLQVSSILFRRTLEFAKEIKVVNTNVFVLWYILHSQFK